ncbi:DUF5067 domain-containing protein [Sanguibacter keddieii]|uniref:DUF5067 domain-containing protein n=1 Tax=Sanguibacter keddieii TaxID=60920 RepID=UPI000A75FE5B|nr:DUF5067 domain-containing protein [Sanguibacter keddieii]
MSYPYDRPGGPGSGGQRGVGASGGQWVPVPGSGGRRSSAGVIVGCVVGLVVAALVVGVAFVVVRSRGVEPGSNTTATAVPTEQQTITSDHYWADVLGGEFHIESTSVVQGPTDQDGAATLLVTLTMTNNTNKPEYALDHIPTLTQKGVIFDLANFSADQNMKVLTDDDVTMVEPGETITVVAAYKYVYVGEPVVFVTQLSLHEHALDFPEIVVQPS